MRFISFSYLLFLAVLVLTASGCSLADLDTRARRGRGLVLVLPGLEGPGPQNYNIARGLDEGGVKTAIRVVGWGTDEPGGMLTNLTDLERNRRAAGLIRDDILIYRRRYPHSPVHIVGQSAGGAIAIMAVEALPLGQPVSRVVLLSPALSPEYDLRPALRRVTDGVYNFYSSLDVAVLGAGTATFGTVDRDFGAAAGLTGFAVPKDMDDEARRLWSKLYQIPWNLEFVTHGHDGGHFGWSARPFVVKHVAPVLLGPADEPNSSRAD